MNSRQIFRCAICHKPAENPYLCLDRRVETVSVIEHEGKPVTTVQIKDCESIFVYCSHSCWQAHEREVAEALELQSTYPAFSFVTPCSCCGASVNRTQPYVNYNITEMHVHEIDSSLVGQCVDDHDFAVLCRDCEDPGSPEAEAETENINEEQGVSA